MLIYKEMIDELQDVLQNDCKRDLLEARDLMRQRKLGLSDWSDAANQNLWYVTYNKIEIFLNSYIFLLLFLFVKLFLLLYTFILFLQFLNLI
jgi:hypothetical protein